MSASVFAQNSSVFAPRKIKVVSGDFGFLRSGQTLDVEFTYVSLRVGDVTEDEYVAQKMGESVGNADEWYKSWISSRKDRFEPSFVEYFNRKLIAQNISITQRGAYKMLVNVYLMEPESNDRDDKQKYSVSMSVRFFNKENDTEEMRLYIIGASPEGPVSNFTDGIAESYEKAAKVLGDFIIKNKKEGKTNILFY
jgi:hypothetical protein